MHKTRNSGRAEVMRAAWWIAAVATASACAAPLDDGRDADAVDTAALSVAPNNSSRVLTTGGTLNDVAQFAPTSTSSLDDIVLPTPSVSFQRVIPNVGSEALPRVHIERVRRSTGDSGLLNFDLKLKNTGSTTLELDRWRATLEGAVFPIPAAEGTSISKGRFVAPAFGTMTGTVHDGKDFRSKLSDDISLHAGTTLVNPVKRYVVVGKARVDGKDRFYLATRDYASGDLIAERTEYNYDSLTSGAANAVERVPSSGADRILVGGGAATTTSSFFSLARYIDDDSLTPDLTFSTDGKAQGHVPNCIDEQIQDIEVVGSGTSQRYFVLGSATCSGARMAVLAAYKQNGQLDLNFGNDGYLKFNTPWGQTLRTSGVSLFRRVERVGTSGGVATLTGFIYTVSKVGNSDQACDDDADGDCYVALHRFNEAGVPDTTIGWNGTVLLYLNGRSLVPVGVESGPNDTVLIGVTARDSDDREQRIGVIRTTKRGDFDSSFNGSGFVSSLVEGRTAVARDMHLASDGSITVTGQVRAVLHQDPAVVRFKSNAQLTFAKAARYGTWSHKVHGGFVDPDGRAVIVGEEGGNSLMSRFRSDGRPDYGGIVDVGETATVRWPDEREVASPFPRRARIELWFKGYGPVSKEVELTEAGALVADNFWSRDEDHPGMFWDASGHHTLGSNHRGGDSQRYAYDAGMYRWNGTKWSEFTVTGDGLPAAERRNHHFNVWDKPVYAVKAGHVAWCWRHAPNHPYPDKDPTPRPGGGNMVWIRHDDGSYALYAHFQDESVPEDICPVECTSFKKNDPWSGVGDDECDGEILDLAAQPRVRAGQLLGKAGHSGSSSNPHLHFHVDSATTDGIGIPVRFRNLRSRTAQGQFGSFSADFAGQAGIAPALGGVLNLLSSDVATPSSGAPCADPDCGTMEDGPCRLIGTFTNVHAYHEINQPDGNYASNTNCVSAEPNEELVCVDGSQQPDCRRCGDGAPLYAGCECSIANDTCGVGLSCVPSTGYAGQTLYSTARCLDASSPPLWECQTDCRDVYGATGYCHRNTAHGRAICATSLGSGPLCGSQGLAYDDGECERECDQDSACAVRGYPEFFRCTITGHCVP